MIKIISSLIAASVLFVASGASAEEERSCEVKLQECDARNASCTAEKQQQYDEWSAWADAHCDKDAERPARPEGSVKKVASKPAKPECAYDATYDAGTNSCTCDTKTFWVGDEPGVPVKIERQPAPARWRGRPVTGCVATRASVVALFETLDARIKQACDVSPTREQVGAPNPERADLYKEGDTYRECGELRAYLHEVVEWKRGLDGAKTPAGEEIPLTVGNWIILWTRVQNLTIRVVNLEGRVQTIEDTYCREDGTHCPDSASDLLDPYLGVSVGYAFRSDPAVDSTVLALDGGITFWPHQRHGVYMAGYVGLAFTPDVDRHAAGARAGYALSFSDDRGFVLKIGFAAGAEPAPIANDVNFVGGELGGEFHPVGPLTLMLSLRAGGVQAARYLDVGGDSMVRIFDRTWRFGATPVFGVGLTF